MILDVLQLEQRYQKRIAGVRDKKVYIGPEIVDIHINNSCNLSCQYCWTHAPGNPAHFDKAHYLSWEKFSGTIKDCVELNVDQVHITGSGEPSLHPQFGRMMRYLQDQPLFVKLFTNATFPLEACQDVIKADQVVVDLSAVDRLQYLEIQGKDLFDRVIANIERLVSLRDSVKPDFLIDIVYIVNAKNIKQRPMMRDLASRWKVNSVYFKKMNVHAHNQSIALPQGPAPEMGEDDQTPPQCLNGWFEMVVKSDDENTSICCRIPQMRLTHQDRWSLKGLWHSPQMMNMRLLGKYGQIQKMHTACKTCPYYDENVQRAEDLKETLQNEKACS